jgi:ubiquinone/menaquinone biosynthesis C-methylase UbiE
VTFVNAYEDEDRARAYASLDFPGTYYLAFRDLPALISEHVEGQAALDFGCGAGRSTRFLRSLGFDVVGIDVSEAMLNLARAADPDGTYLLVPDGDYRALEARRFDLILSAFAFDNIPGTPHRAEILTRLRRLLTAHGRIVLIDCTPEIYVHETVSFTTKDFPENRKATSGQEVRVVIRDVGDDRPVTDIMWLHDDYLSLFAAAGLDLIARHMPLGRDDDPYDWVTEASVSAWVIYVVKPAGPDATA